MTVPTTNVTFSSIQTEFGGSNPISISEYYRGGTYVPIGTATSATDGVAISTSGLIRIGMFRGVSAAGIVGSYGPVLLFNNTISPDPLPYVSIEFSSAGAIFTKEGGGANPVQDGSWYSPTTSGIGSSYWIRATQTASSGTGTATGTLNSWLPLSTNKLWSVTTSVYNSFTRVYTFEIATSSGGTPIVATYTGISLQVTYDF